jgi:hypothetical protein
MSDNHSLQTPSQIKQNPFTSDLSVPPLTQEETEHAVAQLYDRTSVHSFPRVERRYADPAIVNQNYALVSFVPSVDAKPDADGCYGCMKIRGVFASIDEADERAEFLVKNVDSYQSILTTFVGRPFPLIACDGERYGASLRKIDVDKKTEQVISKDVKQKREQEYKEMAEIKKREENLKKDVEREVQDIPDEEVYTTLRVKRSQLIFTYLENQQKLKELKKLILDTDREITTIDQRDPSCKEKYLEQYMEARRLSGFDDEKIKQSDTFMKYLGDDVDLGRLLGE